MENDMLYIPIFQSNESVAIKYSDLKDIKDPVLIMNVLAGENAPLRCWLKVAIASLRVGNERLFTEIMRYTIFNHQFADMYECTRSDLVIFYNAYSAYLTRLAFVCKGSEERQAFLADAIRQFQFIQTVDESESDSWVSRGLLYVVQRQWQNALTQFESVLQDPQNGGYIAALLGKAGVLYHEGQYEKSLKLYQRALKMNPAIVPAVRLGIGMCAFNLKDYQLAYDAFIHVHNLEEDNVEALIGLAVVEITRSKNDISKSKDYLENGLSWLEKAHVIDPGNLFIANLVADRKFLLGDHDIAYTIASTVSDKLRQREGLMRSVFTDLIEAENMYQIGRHYHFSGDTYSPMKFYTDGLALSRNDDRLQFADVQMSIVSGDLEKAIKNLHLLSERNPDNFEIKMRLGFLYKLVGRYDLASNPLGKATKIRPDDIECMLGYAEIFESNNPKRALELYKTCLDMFSRKSLDVPYQLLNNYAVLLHSLGNFNEALTFYEKAIDVCGEKMPTLLYNCGLLHESIGNISKAKEYYIQIQEYGKELEGVNCYIDADLRLADILYNEGKRDESVVMYKTISKDFPDNILVLAKLGDIYVQEDNLPEALEWYNQICTLDQLGDFGLLCVASLKFLNNQKLRKSSDENLKKEAELMIDQAERIFSQVLSRNPRNTYAANGLASVMATRGNIEEAKVLFSKIRELAGDIIPVHINLGHVHIKLGRYSQAVKHYLSALKRQPSTQNPANMLTYIARAYFLNSEMNQAKNYIQKAILCDPENSTHWYNLGLICEKFSVEVFQNTKSLATDVIEAHNRLGVATDIFDELMAYEKSTKAVQRTAKGILKHCKKNLRDASKVVRLSQRKQEKMNHEMRKQEEKFKLVSEAEKRDRILKEEEQRRLQIDQEKQAILNNQRFDSVKEQWLRRKAESKASKKRKATSQLNPESVTRSRSPSPDLEILLNESEDNDHEQISKNLPEKKRRILDIDTSSED